MKIKGDEIVEVNFNLMDHPEQSKKIMVSEGSSFGLFDVAQTGLKANYTNSIMVQNNEEQKMLRLKREKKNKKNKKKKKKLHSLDEEFEPLKNYTKEKPDAF